MKIKRGQIIKIVKEYLISVIFLMKKIITNLLFNGIMYYFTVLIYVQSQMVCSFFKNNEVLKIRFFKTSTEGNTVK